jgi:uncharacterized membrane protein YtjA (UPF0391 family)
MLRWSAIFLVIAIVAAVFGFGGIALAAAGIARILFFVFLILFLVSLISGFASRHRIWGPAWPHKPLFASSMPKSFCNLLRGDACPATHVRIRRLTGSIVKSDGKELVLMADKAGSMTDKAAPITVQWSTVRQITSTAPLYVVTSQGTTVAGAVTTEGTDFLVTPSSGAPQRIPLANVTALRSQSEETAYERSLHPSVLESWQINSSLGFALARAIATRQT